MALMITKAKDQKVLTRLKEQLPEDLRMAEQTPVTATVKAVQKQHEIYITHFLIRQGRIVSQIPKLLKINPIAQISKSLALAS